MADTVVIGAQTDDKENLEGEEAHFLSVWNVLIITILLCTKAHICQLKGYIKSMCVCVCVWYITTLPSTQFVIDKKSYLEVCRYVTI